MRNPVAATHTSASGGQWCGWRAQLTSQTNYQRKRSFLVYCGAETGLDAMARSVEKRVCDPYTHSTATEADVILLEAWLLGQPLGTWSVQTTAVP